MLAEYRTEDEFLDFIFDGREAESPLIETIWRTRSASEGSFISSASTHCSLVIARYQGETTLFVRGPETKATPAHCPADVEFIGINFKLGTYMPHMPARRVMDRQDFVLPEASSRKFWMQGAAWEFPDFENADTFIERLVRQGLLTHDPIVESAMRGYHDDLSLRSVQRRFLRATGLTLKSVQQIERAREAAALLVQGVSVLDVTAELGYFDQAHVTNSLKRLMGQTPAQIQRAPELIIIGT